MATGLKQARALALAIPAALLGGAYISQYGFGLYPCEMCWWQRYAHFIALAFAIVAFMVGGKRWPVLFAALAILASGLIGGFHAGVEYDWWEGLTRCATVTSGGGSSLDAILNAPVIRCDVAPWTLFGISLAGFNFIFSTAGALLVLALLRKDRPA